ncbi:NDMA-dependent alcohol dehydrogenase [Saccharopolyspora sp. NPDC002578]
MKTRGALLREQGRRAGYTIDDIEIGEPRAGEVRVKLAAAGLCHSDFHYDAGDGFVDAPPLLGGHEGAGIVEEVGPGVADLAVGDRVITTFIPSCGHCRWCRDGRGNLCDRGADLLTGRALDGSRRVHSHGEPVTPMTFLGTFAPYTVCPADSLVKFGDDIPMPVAAIAGCAVPTGWGTAVNIAQVRQGDVTVVIGTGGVGMNAVQGARLAGAAVIVAVDPVRWKREKAREFGATHTAPDLAEAHALVADLTAGVMADRAIITVGVVPGDMIEPALGLISKGGVLALGGVGAMSTHQVSLSLFPFVMFEKQLRGGVYGGCKPRNDVPKLLDLYRAGRLKLDELITRTYRLEDINQGYRDMEEGDTIRGVITFE